MPNDIQKIEHNNGQIAQNVAGDQIYEDYSTHYHHYNKEENSASLIFLELDYKNDIVDFEKIIDELLSLKLRFSLNKSFELIAETKKLKSLKQKYDIAKNTIDKNNFIADIQYEQNICQNIHTLFMLIIKNNFQLNSNSNIETFSEILHNIINENILPSFENNWEFQTEASLVTNFLQNIENLQSTQEEILQCEIAQWKRDNPFIECEGIPFGETKKEYEDRKKNFIESITDDFKRNAFKDQKMMEAIQSLKNDLPNIETWLYLPFCCTYTFASGIQFSIFNHEKLTETKKEQYTNLDKSLFDEYYPINILSRIYSRLIHLYNMKEHNEDIFNISVQSKEISFVPLQNELRKVFSEYDCLDKNYWEYHDFSSIHDDWIDEMIVSFQNIHLLKNKI